MNEEMTIGGKKLLSIREVVGRTKYTRDYVAKLAREGSIFGVQIGRQWFIDEVSLSNFEKLSEIELQVRNRQLSAERRREREVKVALANQRVALLEGRRYSAERAVAKTITLIVCGLLAGFSIHVLPGYVSSLVTSESNQLALINSWFENADPDPEVVAGPEHSETILVSEIAFEDTVEIAMIASSTDGIMLLPTSGKARTGEDVAALFSDPVVVEFTEGNAGVVRLQSDPNSKESVDFVVVPLSVDKNVLPKDLNEGAQ